MVERGSHPPASLSDIQHLLLWHVSQSSSSVLTDPPLSQELAHHHQRTSQSASPNIRQHYDAHLRRLERLRRRLTLSSEAECGQDEEQLPANEDIPPPKYPTGMGELTFEELYTATQRIVGYVMRQRLGMLNPDDIDDCIQAGYTKVWERLQANPNLFAGKPKRYIVQAVVFRSKVQRFSHQRHYTKLVYDAEPNHQPYGWSTQRLDTWLDLEQALTRVASHIEHEPVLLLALYCLITQVQSRDVAATFGYGQSTLRSYFAQIKATLALELPGYGPVPDIAQALFIPKRRPVSIPTAQTLIASSLAIPAPPDDPQPLYSEIPTSSSLTAETPAPNRAKLRALIRPYERQPVITPTYPTRWGGAMTIEAILNDPQVRRAAYAKSVHLGLEEADREDLIQKGCIKLWQKLETQPTLLEDKGPVWTGIYIAFSGNARQFHRAYRRQRRFDDPDFDWETADEHLELGLPPHRSQRHAEWASEIDEALDVSLMMNTLAQRYADDPRKLIALYALTTSVKTKDVTPMLGLRENNFAAAIGNQVKADLQAFYSDYQHTDDWEQQVKRGEEMERIAYVAEQVMGKFRLLLALYVVTTSVKRKDVAKTFGIGLTCFCEDIKQIKGLLTTAYRQ